MIQRAVIYIRTSSETQGEKSSPLEQEANCRRLANEKGLHVIRVYRDVENIGQGIGWSNHPAAAQIVLPYSPCSKTPPEINSMSFSLGAKTGCTVDYAPC